MTTPETHICTGHFGQPCGHTASNHAGLGCTACGCGHSDAWVKYQWALAEIASIQLRLVQTERALADRDRRINEGDAIPASFYKRLAEAEKENRVLRASASQSVLRRLTEQGAIAGEETKDG